MIVIPGNAQHIGMREQQEDAFGFSNTEDATFVAHSGIMAVLADGMGGLANGEDASRLAVRSVLDAYETRQPQESIDESLYRVVHRANNAVKDYAYSIGQEHEMGTTLVAAVIQQDRLYWASVGDSHIYLYRDGNMIQLNKDHVYGQELQEQVARGLISREEADTHPEREALTSYIGIPVLEKLDISQRPIQLKPGDKILLCSDGLYRTLSKNEMLLYLERDAQEACDAMIDAVMARRKPYQDNTTVLILELEAGNKRNVPATTSLLGGFSKRQQGDINYARYGNLMVNDEQPIARPSMVPENLNYKRLAILVGAIVLLLTVVTLGVWVIKDKLGSSTDNTTASAPSNTSGSPTTIVGIGEFAQRVPIQNKDPQKDNKTNGTDKEPDKTDSTKPDSDSSKPGDSEDNANSDDNTDSHSGDTNTNDGNTDSNDGNSGDSDQDQTNPPDDGTNTNPNDGSLPDPGSNPTGPTNPSGDTNPKPPSGEPQVNM